MGRKVWAIEKHLPVYEVAQMPRIGIGDRQLNAIALKRHSMAYRKLMEGWSQKNFALIGLLKEKRWKVTTQDPPRLVIINVSYLILYSPPPLPLRSRYISYQDWENKKAQGGKSTENKNGVRLREPIIFFAIVWISFYVFYVIRYCIESMLCFIDLA